MKQRKSKKKKQKEGTLADNLAILMGVIALLIGFAPGFVMTGEVPGIPVNHFELIRWTLIFTGLITIPAVLYSLLIFKRICMGFIPVLTVTTSFAISSTICNWIFFKVWKISPGNLSSKSAIAVYAIPMLPAVFITIIVIYLVIKNASAFQDNSTPKKSKNQI